MYILSMCRYIYLDEVYRVGRQISISSDKIVSYKYIVIASCIFQNHDNNNNNNNTRNNNKILGKQTTINKLQ